MSISVSMGWALEAPVVRVRIAERVASLELQGYDLQWGRAVEIPALEFSVQGQERLGSTWKLTCEGSQVRAEGSGRTRGQTRVWAAPLQVRSGAGFLTVDGRVLRGDLVVWPMGGGKCDVVNHLDLEQYLKGLVNAEFNSRWHPESVKAQVIAARTYALFQVKERRRDDGRHFDLHATVQDQVYGGTEREDFIASTWVEKTRGTVLSQVSGDEPIKAFYHSTCGGNTEKPSEVWGVSYPALEVQVQCPYCLGSPAYRWELPIRKSELETLLARQWSLPKAARLKTLRILGRDSGFRVRSLQTEWVEFGKKVARKLSGVQFRDLIGTQRFKSTRFEVIERGQHYWIKGKGHGHGVGMCQYGAKRMGEEGYSVERILKHYYPNAKLTQMW